MLIYRFYLKKNFFDILIHKYQLETFRLIISFLFTDTEL